MTQFENNIERILRDKLWTGGFFKDHNGNACHMMEPYKVYISNVCHNNDITMKHNEKQTITSTCNKILYYHDFMINSINIMSKHSYTECKYSN